MINLISALLAILFLLKLMWNILTPLILMIRHKRWLKGKGENPGAVEFGIIVEILLLVILAALAFGVEGSIFHAWSATLFVGGVLAILISYVVVVALLWFLRKYWL